MQSIDWPQASPSSTGRAVWRACAARQLPGLPGGRGRQSSAPTIPDSTPIRPPGRASAAPRPGPRFIPAHAGNTIISRKSLAGFSVHPRSRGEHGEAPGGWPFVPGSSPLARGTRRGAAPSSGGPRFIPARAGNTRPPPPRPNRRPVHPRSRGEHPALIRVSHGASGSSPLARGTLPGDHRLHAPHRFIPARAGNTPPRPRPAASSPVHPRSRGEHRLILAGDGHVTGSSPLARGTPEPRGAQRGQHRFIPARAGNTGRPAQRGCPSPVHPRSRGEHRPTTDAGWLNNGSSPLARGTQRLQGARVRVERFIPARAGNTSPGSAPQRSDPVHPRSRGEHVRL